MAFNYSPKVVTDGLELYLDAANPNSYVSGSSTWRDLSRNNRNFTLDPTGITWNPAGYFSLADGGAVYNGPTSISTNSTLVFWMRSTDVQSLFWEGPTTGHYVGAYRVGNKEYYQNVGTPQFLMDTVDTPNIYDYFPNGQWHMVEFKSANLSTWTASKFNTYPSFKFGDGAIASIMIYNRNLTSQESIQNYNATKTRFGLT
jgi:hypothetical protein